MIAKPDTIIEGTWEEVSRRSAELAGKRVRVVVLEEQSDCEQAALRKKADAWLRDVAKLKRVPPDRPPTALEEILIEKMRKQGLKFE